MGKIRYTLLYMGENKDKFYALLAMIGDGGLNNISRGKKKVLVELANKAFPEILDDYRNENGRKKLV